MTDTELYDHFRFEGARILLSPFEFRALPEETAELNALLEPMIRAAWDCEERGGRTLYEVAAELHAAADAMDAGQAIPLRGISGPSEVLRRIAEHVATWKAASADRALDPVRTSRELALRFPSLRNMLVVYYGQDGIAVEAFPDDPRQSLQVVVDDWHPHCPWLMTSTVAQCQEALTLFQTQEALEQFFTFDHGGGSAGLPWLVWLPLIIDVFSTHMREHHPLRWQPARPR